MRREKCLGRHGRTYRAIAQTGTLGCFKDVATSGMLLGWRLDNCESEEVEQYPKTPSLSWCAF